MFRKTLTIFSLIGLLTSLTALGVSYLATNYNAFDTNLWHGYLLFVDPRAGTSFSEGLFDPELCWYPIGLYNLSDVWRSNSRVGWYVRVRLWIPTILFTVVTLWALATPYLHHRRRRFGLCANCGYDLRGSKERCPECGRETGALGAPLLITEE